MWDQMLDWTKRASETLAIPCVFGACNRSHTTCLRANRLFIAEPESGPGWVAAPASPFRLGLWFSQLTHMGQLPWLCARSRARGGNGPSRDLNGQICLFETLPV